MKSNELDRKVARTGAKFLYQEGSSHKYYDFKGVVFAVSDARSERGANRYL